MLSVREVKKRYQATGRLGGRRQMIDALKGVSLEAAAGDIVGLLGPNGAGKTSLIKIMCGLVLPDQGTVEVAGYDIVRQRQAVMRRLGAVLEGNRNLYWRLTVRENLRYFGMIKGMYGSRLRSRMDYLIKRFNLEEKQGVIAANLSRGMQQKLAIMAAVVGDPILLLLDEPTLGLDVEAARDVRAMVEEIASTGKTILLSTHQMAMASEVCNRVAIINRGEILCYDNTSAVFGAGTTDAYTVTFDCPEDSTGSADGLLNGMGIDVNLSSDQGRFTVIVPPDHLYEVLERVRQGKYRLLSVATADADVEDKYLWLVRGGVSG